MNCHAAAHAPRHSRSAVGVGRWSLGSRFCRDGSLLGHPTQKTKIVKCARAEHSAGSMRSTACGLAWHAASVDRPLSHRVLIDSDRSCPGELGSGSEVLPPAVPLRVTAEADIRACHADARACTCSCTTNAIHSRTPNFAELAGNGTVFKRAYVASPLCAPSRAALSLGREYDHQEVPSNSFDVPEGAVTFYRGLRDSAGYHVITAGKDDLTKSSGSVAQLCAPPF